MKKTTQLKKAISSFTYLVIAFIFLISNIAEAQNSNTIYFQDEVVDMPNNIGSFHWDSMPETSKFQGGYFGWLQFNETPSQNIQDQFAAQNLKLIEYFPHKAYLFYFPKDTNIAYLQQSGVRSIIPIENNYKKSSKIKSNDIGDWAMQGSNILITLEHYDFIDANYVFGELQRLGNIAVIEEYKNQNMIQLAVPYSMIDGIAAKSFVKWIELIPAPSVKEDVQGRSIHRASNLDTQTATGRNYTGVGVGVMVRDDGVVGPHIDFQGRIDNSATTTTGQTHGDGVAGILSGAGNLDPTKRGMAAGADVYVVNYGSSFMDSATTDLINDGSVQITNSSYGNGCNGGYTAISQTVDEQTNATPSLLHVFSAGNSGTDDCGYGAGNGWGNITGGHKQGKNVIATANVFFQGNLANSSSRGPALDGRIKPDITAHGQGQLSTDENNGYLTFGGTSGAAPGIAGVSAQLYQVYSDLNAGAHPESALIKATLLNTANDYGNVGPDFKYGWGLVNGLRAAMLIEEGRYLNSTIAQGASNNHSINVPANTTQVRIMVYWSDVAAAPGASPALVNDLDLVVSDPSNTTHQPWVLDSTPNASSLDAPATTGADHLNNMEQVLINNPAAGNYSIDVSGFNVPMGPQDYYVVYEIIGDGLTLTYPQGGEKFVPGTIEVIHWDGIGLTSSTTLEYSTDNGASWTNISTVAQGATNYEWTVPNNVSGECLIRATSGVLTDQSDSVFSIASRVSGVNISQVCPTEVTITWDAVTNATSYDVYFLGDKFMEIVGNSTTTSLVVPITDPFEPIWVAVSANGGNNWTSLRTNAVNYSGNELLNCPLGKDLNVTTINNTPSDFEKICNTDPIIVSSDIRNDGSDPQSDFVISYQLGSEPVVQETYSGTLNSGATVTFDFATPIVLTENASTTLRVWTTLAGDEFMGNDEKSLDVYAQLNSTEIDFIEPFDINGVLPSAWSLDNPDDATTWEERENISGIDGNPTIAAYVDGANYSVRGQEDTIVTEYFDLDFDGTAELSFDIAKAQWSSSYNDGFRVEISTDCGVTYTQIYFKDGLDLATVPYIAATWSPAGAADWRTENIDLTAFVGNEILLKFVNVNDYSNSTFIDNINLTKVVTLSVAENTLNNTVHIFPNPSKDDVNIIVNTTIGDVFQIELLNSLGQRISTVSVPRLGKGIQHNMDVSKYGSGLYFLKIKVDNQEVTKKVIID